VQAQTRCGCGCRCLLHRTSERKNCSDQLSAPSHRNSCVLHLPWALWSRLGYLFIHSGSRQPHFRRPWIFIHDRGSGTDGCKNHLHQHSCAMLLPSISNQSRGRSGVSRLGIRGRGYPIFWTKGMGIWDFNQHRVKRLGKDFVAETETAQISVVMKESHAAAIDDYYDQSPLPYMRIVPKQFACLDDDGIFTTSASTYCLSSFVPPSDNVVTAVHVWWERQAFIFRLVRGGCLHTRFCTY